MTKDTIYQNITPSADFTFNAGVADVFDDMLQRSVPCYRQVIDMVAALLARFVNQGETICDLGCSTGTTLMELSRLLASFDLNFVGIDNSAPMIDKAELKARMLSRTDRVHFIHGDIAEIDLPPCRAFIVNYTLQFIRPIIRKKFLSRLYHALLPGGVVIISEKIISHDPLLNRAFIDFYHDFKKSRGYTETEIARKREALENVLIPFSTGENLQLMRDAGFPHVEPFFQWFNFASYIALKD
ncbi:MAG: carboxy-S-adenosyl-L-methionine synthase CmoA [Desulfobulbaceae bacterium DB1]|nr:MAG: carboxy-S-adenosyl-L-methionine synthase CmoA [Desulfobulbaceae bacterium DB1]